MASGDNVADSSGADQEQFAMRDLPEDVLLQIVRRLDVRAKCRALSVCRHWSAFLANPDEWGRLVFQHSVEQKGLQARDVVLLAERAGGRLKALSFCRSKAAEENQIAERVRLGWKYGAPSPMQFIAPLSASLFHLSILSIDERTSCLGGMSDQLAALLAKNAPSLAALEVFFVPYSRAAESFTDEGMCAIAEGCRLTRLTLHNTGVTNRSIYSVAHYCRALLALEIKGYSEFITNGGVVVLAKSCPLLRRLHLGGRLLKVDDSAIECISQVCTALQSLRLTGSATDGALRSLSACPCLHTLRQLDLRACYLMSKHGLDLFVDACSQAGHSPTILRPTSHQN